MDELINSLGKRVSFRRHLMGWSQKELGARVGVSQQAIEKIENDSTKRPRQFVELAETLGLEPYELLNGTTADRMQHVGNQLLSDGAAGSRKSNRGRKSQLHAMMSSVAPTAANPATPSANNGFSASRDLPVMGRAQGGPDGNLIINDDPIDWTFRPPDLNGVTEAFAIYVTGNSMAPKYEDGDLIYIHPHRPLKKDRYVVIETQDQRGLVKKYHGWDGDELVVSQFNPAKEIRLHKSEIKRIMPVIGSIDG